MQSSLPSPTNQPPSPSAFRTRRRFPPRNRVGPCPLISAYITGLTHIHPLPLPPRSDSRMRRHFVLHGFPCFFSNQNLIISQLRRPHRLLPNSCPIFFSFITFTSAWFFREFSTHPYLLANNLYPSFLCSSLPPAPPAFLAVLRHSPGLLILESGSRFRAAISPFQSRYSLSPFPQNSSMANGPHAFSP